MTEDQLSKALNDDIAFTNLFKYISDLRDTASQFPHRADALFQYVTDHPNQFIRLFKYISDLRVTTIAGQFPQYADALNNKYDSLLIEPALRDNTAFTNLFKYISDLRDTASQFPHRADALFQYVTDHPNQFIRLFKYISDLRVTTIAGQFPQYADALNNKYDSLLIEPALRDNTAFTNLFKYISDLRDTASQFPQYVKTLIKTTCKDPALFDQIIKNDSGLSEIKTMISNNDELKKSSDPIITILRGAPDFQTARSFVKRQMVDAKNAKLGLFLNNKQWPLSRDTRNEILEFISGDTITKPGSR